MADEFELNGKITGDCSNFEKAIDKATTVIEDFGKNTEKTSESVEGGLKSWGINLDKFYEKGSSVFKNIGIDIDKFASHFGIDGKLLAGITAVTVALEKFGESMQKMTSEIARGTGAVGEELTKLKDSANDALIMGIGRSTEETGIMIATLNTRFGVTGEELTKLTNQFDKFSDATGVDTKTAINGIADAVSRWNLSTDETLPLMNQLTKASQMSGASIDSLLSGIKSGQSIYSQFGMSLTDTIAFMSSMEKQGISSENALMGMRTALSNFSKNGIEASKGFEQIKNSIKNAETETEALTIAIETFGQRSGPEMVQVFRNSSVSIDEFKNSLIDSNDAIYNTANASKTVSDSLNELMGSLMGTFAGFGEGIANLFRSVIDIVTQFVQQFAPIIKPIADIFNTVFSFVGEVLKSFVSNLMEFQNRYNAVFQGVKDVLVLVRDAIRRILQKLLDIFNNAFGMIFAILEGDWGLAWEYAKNSMLKVADIVLDVISLLINSFSKMVNAFNEKINKILEGYNKFADSAVGQFLGLKKAKPLDIIPDVNLSKLTGVEDKLLQSNAKIQELLRKKGRILTGELAKVEDDTSKVTMDIVGDLDLVGETGADLDVKLGKTTEGITTNFENMNKKSEKSFSDLIKNIKKVFSKVKSIFKDLISINIEDITDGLLEIEDKILTFFVETLPKIPEFLKTVFDSIIKTMSAISGDSKFIESVVSIIVDIVDIILDNFPIIFDGLMKLAIKLTTELISRLPELIWMIIKEIPKLVMELGKVIIDSIGGIFKGIGKGIGKLFGFATGVNNAPSGLALVGEQGPELVDFKGGERVYNNQDTKQILSSSNSGTSGNTFNVTFNNVQDTSAYTMMRQLKDYNRQMAINGVL